MAAGGGVVRSTKKQGSIVGDQAREVIQNVIKFFDDEAKYGARYHIKQATKRAASATGRSERLVKAIRKEVRNALDPNRALTGMKAASAAPASSSAAAAKKKKKKKEPEENLKSGAICVCLIRKLVLDSYTMKKELPTFARIQRLVTEEMGYMEKGPQLRRVLRNMGFVARRCVNKRKVLIEKSDIVQWRSQFLRLLRMNAVCPYPRPTVFVDEMTISVNGTVESCMAKVVSPGQKVTIIHAAGKDGLLQGAELVFSSVCKSEEYTGEVTSQLFEKWLVEQLIPHLGQSSIIVMDNARCHTGQSNPVPDCTYSKTDIQTWLLDNGIQFEPDSRKQELMYLVEVHKPPKSYRVEELLQQGGHSVVWLPPHHCDLSLLKYVWFKIKDYVMARKTPSTTLDQLLILVREAVGSLSPDELMAAYGDVEKLQDDYWQQDTLMETVIEKLGINFVDTGSDDEDFLLEDDDEPDDEANANLKNEAAVFL